jgi:8-oxo-dGTP pyrophosphatase MutT (NUDIX family)
MVKTPGKTSERVETVDQVSAGGVAVRRSERGHEVVIVLMIPERRWQLPKGIIDPGETPEQAALREVREEAGVVCSLVEPLEVIEYWFFGNYDGTRKRYHKFVHFFLMNYESGDVADHDHEVEEARWVSLDEAVSMLAFKDEQRMVGAAADRLGSLS